MSDGEANGELPGNRPVRESGVSGTGGDVSSVSSERCEALRGRARTKVRWSQGTGVGVSISLRVVQSAHVSPVRRDADAQRMTSARPRSAKRVPLALRNSQGQVRPARMPRR